MAQHWEIQKRERERDRHRKRGELGGQPQKSEN